MQPSKDIERVAEIWLNESVRVHNFVPEPEKFWCARLPNFRKETMKTEGYVWEEDGLIKGFMTIEVDYIRELFVDFQCQCKGIGTALLDLVKSHRRLLYLHVYVRNLEAINWYIGRGFILDKIHEPETQNPKQLKYKMVWSKPLVQ